MTDLKYHAPVMCREVTEHLKLAKGATVLDCTVGTGGHAEALLKEIGSGGRLIGLDQDEEALALARDRLKIYSNCILIQANFRDIDAVLDKLKIKRVDGVVFDLGVSSLQLDSATRGFSIRIDAPLDMRMDKRLKASAFDLVNFFPQEGLSDILRKYGQERWCNRIARGIVRERKKSKIMTTRELAELVRRLVPRRYSRIHPATRTFQALRIAVNDELGALREGLNKCINYLKGGARLCVISFHSLEDGIVKRQFRKFAEEGNFRIITKKPLTPSRREIEVNPRARSAKLRVLEKTEKKER
ncbi:MAG: 16S rRNA (cytosine(1402)-N(4))-methyltransferase RsmH [Candidatus Omnitrophota bacterium]|nr:MAG: 16S rRNA (cytosine(1402)-N(4))-methyltransferase RsmH [Candidatus Omnitrophota bacterium]